MPMLGKDLRAENSVHGHPRHFGPFVITTFACLLRNAWATCAGLTCEARADEQTLATGIRAAR